MFADCQNFANLQRSRSATLEPPFWQSKQFCFFFNHLTVIYFFKNMPEYYYGEKITLTASPVRRAQWRDNFFYPGHLTLFKVFSMQTRNMRAGAFLFKLLSLVPLVRLLAAIWRDGFSETFFLHCKLRKQQHKRKPSKSYSCNCGSPKNTSCSRRESQEHAAWSKIGEE